MNHSSFLFRSGAGVALLWLAILLPASGDKAVHQPREYFVSLRGNDEASGFSRQEAFGSIAHGISKLQPGDTLTILPGEYFESLQAELAGTEEAPITIRAERPGTVWVRGDLDVDGFEKVEKTRYTYVLPLDGTVEGIAERTTLRQYAYVPSAIELDEIPGSFYYDTGENLLYVRTTDGQHPDQHALSVSVTNGFGLLLRAPRHVVVDGLVFSGFNSREVADRPGHRTRWGILATHPEQLTIRRCTVFFNGGGIGLGGGSDVVVEECVAFANNSPHHASGGNIITRGTAVNFVYRNNISHTTLGRGLRFYTGGGENCVVEGNLTYRCGQEDIQFKGGNYSTCSVVDNVVLGGITLGGANPANVRGNLTERPLPDAVDSSNVSMGSRFDPAMNFADPVHHDYRLQSTSELRGAGPDGTDPGPHPYRDEVFYVSPDGDDEAAGTALDLAWATLERAAEAARAGHTVYVREGVYTDALKPAHDGKLGQPIVFRRYGRDQVVLEGGGDLSVGLDLSTRKHVIVEGFAFRNFTGDAVVVDESENVELRKNQILSSGGDAIRGGNSQGLVVENNLLRDNGGSGIDLVGAVDAQVTGNVFEANGRSLVLDDPVLATLWSNRNSFGDGEDDPGIRCGDWTYASLEEWQEAHKLDLQSQAFAPMLVEREPGIFQPSPESPLVGAGRDGGSVGPWELRRFSAPLKIEDVRLHSVTATTANIEWWTPATRARTILEWGKAGEPEKLMEELHSSATFHTASLSGLEPDTEYVFRVRASSPAWEFHIDPDLAQVEVERERAEAASETDGFRTLAQDQAPRTYYVSTTGNDSNSGLAPDDPWETIRHAAGEVRAGDTVIVAPGTYEEYVVVRATGDEDRPVSFKAADGGEVWMEGSGRVRPNAFRVAFKDHVRLEGFRFRDFALNPYGTTDNTGAIHIVGGANNVVARGFYDGRSAIGYTAYFIEGSGTENLLIENCVIIQGWNGMNFRHCPGLTIRHSLFYNCLIRALSVFNEADEPVTLTHNIFGDNIPTKVGNTIVSVWHLEALTSDHNLYFARLPVDERRVLSAFRVDGELVRRNFTFEEMREVGLESNGVFGNPRIPVTDEMEAKPANWPGDELHRSGSEIRPLDFQHFLGAPDGPAGRSEAGAPIGLDRAVFQ